MDKIFNIDSDVVATTIEEKFKENDITYDLQFRNEYLGRTSGYYSFNVFPKNNEEGFVQRIIDMIPARSLAKLEQDGNYILHYHELDLKKSSSSSDAAYLDGISFAVHTTMLHKYLIQVTVHGYKGESVHDPKVAKTSLFRRFFKKKPT